MSKWTVSGKKVSSSNTFYKGFEIYTFRKRYYISCKWHMDNILLRKFIDLLLLQNDLRYVSTMFGNCKTEAKNYMCERVEYIMKKADIQGRRYNNHFV